MRRFTAWVAAVLVVAGVIGAIAQNDPAASPPAGPAPVPEGSRVIMEWNEFKKVANWEDGIAARKGEFVIPWKDVKDLLGLEIKNVDTAELKLPWKEFKTLLEWSVSEAEKKEQKDPPPVPYVITSAEYLSKELSKDGAVFTATFKINVLDEEGSWKKIDILPQTVAVSETKLPDGVFMQLSGTHYSLLTTQSGEQEVQVTFSVMTTESAGLNTLSFGKVPSGTCVLDVTVPGQDEVDVSIPGAQSKLQKKVPEGTRVVAAYPANAEINLSWERAIAEGEKVPAKLYTETRTLISVADGLLLGHAQVAFSILHTPTRTLEMNVTDGVSILEVTGKEIRDWRVTAGKLTLQLDKEIIGSEVIDVKYEASLDMNSGKAAIPVVTGNGVEREKGHIAIVALTNVEIAGDDVTGAHAVDVKALPAEIMGMTSQPILLAYRYVDPEFQVGLKISKHEDVDVLLTVVDRAHFTVMQTFDGRRITRAIYNVRNNRNQFLRLMMPTDAAIWSATVAGRATQPARDTEGRVLLPLVRSEGSSGMSAFPVELVYAETGVPPDAKGRGTARVDLPTCSEPIMHIMVDLHVPEEGRYREFEGTLREVEHFTALAGVPLAQRGGEVAQQLQQVFVQREQAKVTSAGATPIEVQLPVSGEVYHLEKILVVEGEQWFSYEYSGLSR